MENSQATKIFDFPAKSPSYCGEYVYSGTHIYRMLKKALPDRGECVRGLVEMLCGEVGEAGDGSSTVRNGVCFVYDSPYEVEAFVECGIQRHGVVSYLVSGEGARFLMVTREGCILELLNTKSTIRLNPLGAIADDTLLNAFFNSRTGSLLIATKRELILLDSRLDVVNTVKVEDAYAEKNRAPAEFAGPVSAKWTKDNKYIALALSGDIHVFSYNLVCISNTRDSCNRIMNSRLMNTKKHLRKESEYVDVVRRPGEEQVREKTLHTQRDSSVLFEERTEYKLVSWHSSLSLVYAVTARNNIFVLERNSYKFKEIRHIREEERGVEKIEDNEIVGLSPHGDYLYIVNRERNADRTCDFYFKIYYVKNNVIYLKSNRRMDLHSGVVADELVEVEIEAEKDVVVIRGPMGLEVYRHEKILSRTRRSVVDVDGARALCYELEKNTIPPPFFNKAIPLRDVPEALVSPHGLPESFLLAKYEEGFCKVFEDREDEIVESVTSLKVSGREAASLPSVKVCGFEKTDACRVELGEGEQFLAVLVGDRLCLIHAKCTEEMKGVTSFLARRGRSGGSLLVTKTGFSRSEVLEVVYDQETCKFRSTSISFVGGSRLVYSSGISIVLITEIGTLETLSPKAFVQREVAKLAGEGALEKAIELSKKHGCSLNEIGELVQKEVEQNRIGILRAGNVLDMVKIVLKSPSESGRVIAAIQRHLEGEVGLSGGKAPPKQWSPLLAALILIYAHRASFDSVFRLIRHVARERGVVPETFEALPEDSVAVEAINMLLLSHSRESLAREALEHYEYLVCYLILHATETPFEETNDVVLVGGREIDSSNYREEVERRANIARINKNRKKAVEYTIRKMSTEYGKGQLDGAAEAIEKHFHKNNLRDYYVYMEHYGDSGLAGIGEDTRESLQEVVSRMFKRAGNTLEREGNTLGALEYYRRGGACCRDERVALETKLGLWRDVLAYVPKTDVAAALEKLESVLVADCKIREAGMMYLSHGSILKAIHFFVEASAYTDVQVYLEEVLKEAEGKEFAKSEPGAAQMIPLLLSGLTDKMISEVDLSKERTRKYVVNLERLRGVRERKDRERKELRTGRFADDCCESTTLSKTFITNSFAFACGGEKKRSSKLRNKEGGRYEEEYVQYVCKELIEGTAASIERLEKVSGIMLTVEKILTALSVHLPVAGYYEKISREMDEFRDVTAELCRKISLDVDELFASRNTEDDPLYDPARPVILAPPIDRLTAYLREKRF
jgi:hypothetical protein